MKGELIQDVLKGNTTKCSYSSGDGQTAYSAVNRMNAPQMISPTPSRRWRGQRDCSSDKSCSCTDYGFPPSPHTSTLCQPDVIIAINAPRSFPIFHLCLVFWSTQLKD